MDFDEQMEVSHFVLTERKCRVCGKTKDLIEDELWTTYYN